MFKNKISITSTLNSNHFENDIVNTMKPVKLIRTT